MSGFSFHARALALVLASAALGGCGQHIYNLKVPLDAPAQTVAAPTPDIRIDDLRPEGERVVHTGGGLFRCERWYGDDTYDPPKLAYLQQLLAMRTSAALHLSLERFDTIEYCENTARRASAAAAYGASAGAGGTPIYIPSRDLPLGDSVLIRLKGGANGKPFDVQRQFDYSDLTWRFLEMPAANPQYRERFRTALAQMADEIAAIAAAGSR